jgi:nitroreductase
MTAIEAIRGRRSIKSFTAAPVPPAQIETLLELAVLGPNFRMSQPWRFLVLGPDGRGAYGRALGSRKAKKLEDVAAKDAMVERNVADAVAVPAMIGVVQLLNENLEIREDDYAAIWMGIENLLIGALELGLGTHVRTGAVLGDAALREPLGVGDGERLVALIQLGVPTETPTAKPRASAAERTTVLP